VQQLYIIQHVVTWLCPACLCCCCCGGLGCPAWWLRAAGTGCWACNLGMLSPGKNDGWAWYRGLGVRRPSPSCSCWKFFRRVDSPGTSVTALAHRRDTRTPQVIQYSYRLLLTNRIKRPQIDQSCCSVGLREMYYKTK